jgi:hypothetical protein
MLPDIKVNKDLNPRTAKMLDEKTISGSLVTPNTAGIESTANAMSLNSRTTNVSNRGVAILTPSGVLVKNLLPSYVAAKEIRKQIREQIQINKVLL